MSSDSIVEFYSSNFILQLRSSTLFSGVTSPALFSKVYFLTSHFQLRSSRFTFPKLFARRSCPMEFQTDNQNTPRLLEDHRRRSSPRGVAEPKLPPENRLGATPNLAAKNREGLNLPKIQRERRCRVSRCTPDTSRRGRDLRKSQHRRCPTASRYRSRYRRERR